ncbi:MAG: hypothetical protein JO047_11540 [Alphaproteobacteria bacterium]|nr:hypothetical protein [Alphaproteobacteria bacterium]
MFVNGNAGHDVVVGFGAKDAIFLANFGAAEAEHALATQVHSAAGTTITLSDGTQVLFAGVAHLTASNFG